jgi:hypothetical protein
MPHRQVFRHLCLFRFTEVSHRDLVGHARCGVSRILQGFEVLRRYMFQMVYTWDGKKIHTFNF